MILILGLWMMAGSFFFGCLLFFAAANTPTNAGQGMEILFFSCVGGFVLGTLATIIGLVQLVI